MPLTRLTLKLALIPTLIFAAVIALIRAQPYDDSELRTFLTPPEGCPAPCFMGIRPGVTRVDEALAILESHESIAEITGIHRNFDGSIGSIHWIWVENPKLPLRNGGLYSTGGSVSIQLGIVDYISVNTSIKVIRGWITWGQPEQLGISAMSDPYTRIVFVLSYKNGAFTIDSDAPCPYRKFLQSFSTLTFSTERGYPAQFEVIPSYASFLRRATEFEHLQC